MKKHLLTCIFAAPLLLFAQQTYVWNVSSGSWTNPSNWTPARSTPAVNDILEFSANATVTDMPASESIGKLWLRNNAVVTLSTTIASVITIGHATVAAPHLAVASGSALIVIGNNAVEFNIDAARSGEVYGNIDFFDGAHRLTAASANSLKFKSGATFTANTGFNGNAFGITNLNSVVFESGATYIQKTGGNPFGAAAPNAVSVFNAGSIFRFQRATLPPSLAGRVFGHLYIEATVNFGGIGSARDCTIQNDLKLSSADFWFHPESGSHTGNFKIYGDIICEGTAYINIGSNNLSGAVQMLGTSQTIGSGGGTGSITIKNLTVNNTVTQLDRNLTITGTLGLQQGIIHTHSTALLTLDAGANIQSCTHDYTYLNMYTNMGCDNSHVEGPIKKSGLSNTDFAFPIGANSKLRPVILKNATGDFTAEFKNNDPYLDIGSSLGAGIHHISHIEYWNITGTGTAYVELSFYDPNSGGITDMNALRVAHYSGSEWIDLNTGTYKGTPGSNGSVTSAATSQFGSFSLASSSNYHNNPLPAELNGFKATVTGTTVVLDWVAGIENQTAGYFVEKSAEGVWFEPLPFFTPANKEWPHSYQLMDKEPFSGSNFYRLKIMGTDGSVRYSKPEKAYLSAFSPFMVYPNPAREKIFIKFSDSSSKSTFAIVHINGSVVRLINSGNLTTINVDISNLSPGLYYIKKIRGQSILVVPFIKYNQ